MIYREGGPRKSNGKSGFTAGSAGASSASTSYAEQEYAKKLEADDRVENYEENCCLDPERFQHVNPVGIRAAYMKQEWKTDFLIHHTDGTQAVREVVREDELTKATVLEQLELSRRYWEAVGVSDWRVALFREGGCAPRSLTAWEYRGNGADQVP